MKEINELNFPENLKYAEEHEWVKADEDKFIIGISDYAQDQLGDVVFVELPQVDDEFKKGDEFGTVESTKAVSELYMPVGGKVTAINGELEDSPDFVNTDPYGKGWMIEIEPSDKSQLDDLMDKDAYIKMLKNS